MAKAPVADLVGDDLIDELGRPGGQVLLDDDAPGPAQAHHVGVAPLRTRFAGDDHVADVDPGYAAIDSTLAASSGGVIVLVLARAFMATGAATCHNSVKAANRTQAGSHHAGVARSSTYNGRLVTAPAATDATRW